MNRRKQIKINHTGRRSERKETEGRKYTQESIIVVVMATELKNKKFWQITCKIKMICNCHKENNSKELANMY